MNNRIKWGLFLTIMLALIAVLAFPVLAQDNGTAQNTITVSGIGQASGSPDVAYIELGVDITNENVGAAYSQAGTAIDSIRAALQTLGIADEDMATSSLNIWWDEPYPPGPGQSGGFAESRIYHVNTTVRVTVRDISQIESVINTAVENGANNVYGLTFGISDSEVLEREARAEAVNDALARAQHLAELNGVTLGDALVIVEGGSYPGPGPYYGVGGGGGFAAAESIGIQPGQLSVSVSVTITYAINR